MFHGLRVGGLGLVVEQEAQQQLTESERSQIEGNIKEDLVEHLYRSVPSGVTTVGMACTAVFFFFYHQAPALFLKVWLASFYIALSAIAILFFLYKKNKHRLPIQYWQQFLSFFLICCGVLWGTCIFFNPSDQIHQFALLGVLFMVSASLSMATVGIFILSCISVLVILSPLIIALALHEDFYYQFGGVLVSLYAIFLLGMNYRSTQWFIRSLRLKIENSYVTYQANHDILSGLPNQRLLSHYLEEIIQKKLEFAMVCFSVNRLEMFNNSFGYQVSDSIVQGVAKRLKTFFHEVQATNKGKFQYFLCHPRTDSFIILITPVNIESLEKELQQLFKAIEPAIHIGNTAVEVTASIGVSICPKDGDNAKAISSNTYAAMFQAKQLGGNQLVYYKREMNEKTPYLLELENDLHHALKRGEFFLNYQPIINLRDGSIAGMEALVRWHHPKHGLISPLDFIFLAEENGMIIPIGHWILKQACYQAVQWIKQDKDYRSVKMAVNIAARQLKEGSFLQDLDTILAESGLSAENLELELTETAILDNTVSPLIRDISKKQISLSIDDFGTGYSGLSYLRFFKIDTLKIDQSFIQDATNNNESATIVSAILAMAKELHIETIAEGIETEQQLAFLLERDCQYAQGYYFSKPLSATDFTKLLKSKIKYDTIISKAKMANEIRSQ